MPLRMLTLASGLLLTASSFAQSNAIKGQVKDASGEPVMGATITVNGSRQFKCNKSIAQPTIDQVRIVCEYPDVFPDVLPGMPPDLDIEFIIELIPGTGPIAQRPYSMNPS